MIYKSYIQGRNLKMEKNTITLYAEPCDCGSRIRHNNGGNYHAIHRLHSLEDTNGVHCLILEETTTREDFPGDEFEVLVFRNDEFVLEDEERAVKNIIQVDREVKPIFSSETITILKRPVLFRAGEAKIIWQNTACRERIPAK
jgi:hypothetical protein